MTRHSRPIAAEPDYQALGQQNDQAAQADQKEEKKYNGFFNGENRQGEHRGAARDQGRRHEQQGETKIKKAHPEWFARVGNKQPKHEHRPIYNPTKGMGKR